MADWFGDVSFWQWALLVVFGIVFLVIGPLAKTPSQFFSALSAKGKQPNMAMLTSSLVISWIFAKSITNSANLSLEFGFVGGIAYAVYYLSFLVAGLVIYKLRVSGGFTSIHDFLRSKFGRIAVIIFSLLIAFRLFNEVWSNSMVIGSYFGGIGSGPYYASILIFTVLTLAYTLRGGLRSSLLTDAIQMALFGVLLFVLFSFILPSNTHTASEYIYSGEWTMATGLNLLFVAVIQSFSYPFHDPVLTDRGFISPPKLTLKSYVLAAVVGFVCIAAFSLIGVFAKLEGLEGSAPVEVSKMLGTGAMLAMNLIMITSAASTLDSAFSSFSKLMVVDILPDKVPTVSKGRWMMVLLVVVGTLPVFTNPEVLSATTVSGTMVLGLAPIFLLWFIPAPPISFHLSIGFGIVVGACLALGIVPEYIWLTTGRYADLFAANVWGTIGCFILYLAPILFSKRSA
jgi:Na+/proline symporter